MATSTAPSKEAVRTWLNDRRASPTPPPTPEEIRRQLGWEMLHNNRR